MCRITGFRDFAYKGDYNLEDTITHMRDTLTHGGPDDAGGFIDKNKGLCLGHRRLSILDLSKLGHQPMEFENLVITYNGEVYNFRELRKELEKDRYIFSSNSDTEVILKLLHKSGFDAVHKFRGMWAFALWDKAKEELILCRDRVGIKPLYWYYKDGLFMFASELKPFHEHPKFHKELDKDALSLYLQYGYITSPYSIFKFTHKLEPGYFLRIDKLGNIQKIQYWDAEEHFIKGMKEKRGWPGRNEDEITSELEEILTDSFRLRLVSDVPVGVFLSGGIDSSLVTALLQKEAAQPLKTFTIGFHEKDYNEATWAKKVADHLGTDHTEHYFSPREAFGLIQKFPELYDEPFGDVSAIPTHLVSLLAKKQVKVAISADGADEQFCGYPKYWHLGKNVNKMRSIPSILSHLLLFTPPDLAEKFYNTFKFILPQWTHFRDKFIKLRAVFKEDSFLQQVDAVIKFFQFDDLKRLGINSFKSQLEKVNNRNVEFFDDLSKMMLVDLTTYLTDNILVKTDRATMGIALECREPFLDVAILEYSSSMPVELKYKNGVSKYILRKILYKYVPKELVDRPKQGFDIPIHEWFKKDLKSLYNEYLNEERIKREGLFNDNEVSRLLSEFFNKGMNSYKLWLLFIFEMWREKYL
ncbi:MAG: asparagine synthase (glutamine-hydrolyzing) [Candidatus Brocadiaceae bacterium]